MIVSSNSNMLLVICECSRARKPTNANQVRSSYFNINKYIFKTGFSKANRLGGNLIFVVSLSLLFVSQSKLLKKKCFGVKHADTINSCYEW